LIFGFGAGSAIGSALGLAFGSIPGFEFGVLRLHGRDGWVSKSSSATCRAPNGPGPAPWGQCRGGQALLLLCLDSARHGVLQVAGRRVQYRWPGPDRRSGGVV